MLFKPLSPRQGELRDPHHRRVLEVLPPAPVEAADEARMIRAAYTALILMLAFGQMGLESEAQALEEDAAEKVMRVRRALLLDNSTVPARLAECDRFRPDAFITVNEKKDGIRWYRRTCIWASFEPKDRATP